MPLGCDSTAVAPTRPAGGRRPAPGRVCLPFVRPNVPIFESASGSVPGASDDLASRLLAGDAAAYEELVRIHGPRMLAVATRYMPRPGDADDVLQDAFVSVVRFIGSFKRGSSLGTWLHRIVVNSALMALRKRRRRPEAELDDAAVESGSASPWGRWPPPSVSDVLVDSELRAIVRAEVDRLPEAQRSVLLLRDIEGLELKTIAELLGVGLSTVKMRLHRARVALESALGPRLSEHAS